MTSSVGHITEELIEAVWQKGQVIPNNNPNEFRQDYASAWIRREDYGKNTIYGWVIDHIRPRSKGGTDGIENLVPLQYQNSCRRKGHYPRWQTAVSSEGVVNVDNVRNWYVEQGS